MADSIHTFTSRDQKFTLGYRRQESTKRILDLGCGDGQRAIALAAHSFNRVTGLDSSESLLSTARKRAEREKVNVTFVKGCPSKTKFDAASFDEVQLLGVLFGHGATARADVELLVEAQRILRPGGVLRLSFLDGEWLRRDLRAETLETPPAGFICRLRHLVEDGHCILTKSISSKEASKLTTDRTVHDRLYSPGDVSDLLRRLGFETIAYDGVLSRAAPGIAGRCVPSHVVHCNAPSWNVLTTLNNQSSPDPAAKRAFRG